MIININNLNEIRNKHLGKAVVLTSGTFDILHIGHIHFLEKAKQYGDILVVLMSGDSRVKSRKGIKRPIIPENERAQMLESLKTVDCVVIDQMAGTDNYELIIDQLKPDYYVTDGPDPRFINLLNKSKFIILNRDDSDFHGSTTAIIEKIVQTYAK